METHESHARKIFAKLHDDNSSMAWTEEPEEGLPPPCDKEPKPDLRRELENLDDLVTEVEGRVSALERGLRKMEDRNKKRFAAIETLLKGLEDFKRYQESLQRGQGDAIHGLFMDLTELREDVKEMKLQDTKK
jgi:predicted  nucleic acid-binding Zn-ribbon protein